MMMTPWPQAACVRHADCSVRIGALQVAEQAQESFMHEVRTTVLPQFQRRLRHARDEKASLDTSVFCGGARHVTPRCHQLQSALQELHASLARHAQQLEQLCAQLARGSCGANNVYSASHPGSFTFDALGAAPAAASMAAQPGVPHAHAWVGPECSPWPPCAAPPVQPAGATWLWFQGLLDAHQAQVIATLLELPSLPATCTSATRVAEAAQQPSDTHHGLPGVLEHVFQEALQALAYSTAHHQGLDAQQKVEGTIAASSNRKDCELGTGHDLLQSISRVAHLLAILGLSALCREVATHCLDACTRAHCHSLAQGVLHERVLPAAWSFLTAVPLQLAVALARGEQAARSKSAWAPTATMAFTEQLGVWRRRLEYVVFETLGTTRCSQIFDIVIDLPESMPAVEDLADCLAHTNLQAHLVCTFRSAVATRLLHAGASAADMVHAYVSIIRVMRMLDPQGIILPAVVGPIRRYLRSRPDTVRCVVEHVTGAPGPHHPGWGTAGPAGHECPGASCLSLLEEQQQEALATAMVTSLAAHSQPKSSGMGPGAKATVCSEESVLALLQAQGATVAEPPASSTQAWVDMASDPDGPTSEARSCMHPSRNAVIPALAGSSASTTSPCDLVGHLVQVFRSREHFLHEYRSCLAQQLLHRPWDGEVHSQAVRTVELLKLRFGDARLHACEVMLKDVADSRRFNIACRGASSDDVQAPVPVTSWTSATVTSYLFWPVLGGWGDEQITSTKGTRGAATVPAGQPPILSTSSGEALASDAALRVPRCVRQALDVYGAHFQRLKAPRQLHWKAHLGLVELQIDVNGVCLEAVVSPTLATLLLAFDEEYEEPRRAGRATGIAPAPTFTSLTAAQLAVRVGLPIATVRRRILFWVEVGLVVEHTPLEELHSHSSPAHFGPGARGRSAGSGSGPAAATTLYTRTTRLDSTLHGARLTDVTCQDEANLVGGLGTSEGAGAAALEHMVCFEPYIMSVLHSMGGMSLDRLHSMLKRFVVSPKFDAPQEQLAAFLACLVAAGKLSLHGNVYSAAGVARSHVAAP